MDKTLEIYADFQIHLGLNRGLCIFCIAQIVFQMPHVLIHRRRSSRDSSDMSATLLPGPQVGDLLGADMAGRIRFVQTMEVETTS